MAAVVVLATWPLVAVVGTSAVGHPYGDMPDHYWGTWWFGGELLAGRWPSETGLSHFPERLPLWYVDPLGALAALLFRPFGFPAAWNLLLLLQVGLAALAGYVVGEDVTQDRACGVLAGVVAGASPYVLGLLHSGLSEFLGLGPVVLFVWMLLRATGLDPRGRPPPPRAVAWSAALLGLSALGSPYHAVFGALFALAALPGAGWRVRAPVLARVLAGGALVSLPAALAALATLRGGGAVTQANAPGWAAHLPATDLLTFVRPGAYYFPDTPALGNPGILHVNYLGWGALALAALAARGPFLRVGLLFGVFLLGPRLAVGQQLIAVGDASVVLPLGWLAFPGSPVAWVHQPYRIVGFALPWLAMAAALGAARLPPWTRPLLALGVLLEALLLSPARWPLATRPMTTPPHLSDVAGPTLDWPPDASTWNRDYLLWATQHGQPVPYGVNVFLGDVLRRDPLVDGLLRALERLPARARNRDVPFAGRLLAGSPPRGSSRLAGLGFRRVVVHRAALSPGEWTRTRALLVEACGAPVHEDADVGAWVVR